jgi:hypothetical protein
MCIHTHTHTHIEDLLVDGNLELALANPLHDLIAAMKHLIAINSVVQQLFVSVYACMYMRVCICMYVYVCVYAFMFMRV